MNHLQSPSPRIEVFRCRDAAAGAPHFERNPIKVRCEQVVFFSLGKVPIFGELFDVFFHRDRMKSRLEIETE